MKIVQLETKRVILRQMKNMDANFEHLALPVGHRLREHVLYGIRREDFELSYNKNEK